MIDVEIYMQRLILLLQNHFGERLVYVGLQGSYLRGEATPNSDLDVMVVLDGLSVLDLDNYRLIIESLECFDRSCGFVCSREDLLHWNRLEICNLLYSTKDYYGILKDLVPEYSQDDIRSFVKVSINNLYHEICHRYVHGERHNSMAALPGIYKSVFFILQNLYYLTSGTFISSKRELLERLTGKNRDVLERSIGYGNGNTYDFAESFMLLFTWCQETLSIL